MWYASHSAITGQANSWNMAPHIDQPWISSSSSSMSHNIHHLQACAADWVLQLRQCNNDLCVEAPQCLLCLHCTQICKDHHRGICIWRSCQAVVWNYIRNKMRSFGFLAAFTNSTNQGTNVTCGSQIQEYSPAAVCTHAVTITSRKQEFIFWFGCLHLMDHMGLFTNSKVSQDLDTHKESWHTRLDKGQKTHLSHQHDGLPAPQQQWSHLSEQRFLDCTQHACQRRIGHLSCLTAMPVLCSTSTCWAAHSHDIDLAVKNAQSEW